MTIRKSVLVLAAGVLLASVPLTASPTAAADPDPERDRVDAFVAEQQGRTDVPGTAYAVVSAEGVEVRAATGVDGDGDPVTPATPFLWGSVSKPVAATLVVLLAEDGLLDLDDPVVEHLPDFATSDPVTREATVRQLLTHTAGLPEGLELTDRYDPGRAPADVVDEIAGLDPVAAPGERHVYSSLGYSVVAALAERLTGRPYGELLADRVLAPARMTGVPADPARAAAVLPPGHRYVAGSPRAFDAEVDASGQASGYLVGTLDDLAAFAQVQLAGGPVLDDRQRALLHTPAVPVGDDGGGYGLGWRSGTLPGGSEPIVWHGGAVPGYTSAIVLLPERDRAVVVLQDAYGPFQEAGLLDTAFGLAAIVAGEEPTRSAPDPVYPVLIAGLAAVGIGLLVAVVLRVRALARPLPVVDPPRRRGLGAGLRLVALLAVAGLLLALPRAFGVPVTAMPLWAPDVGWLVIGDLALCAIVAVLGAAAIVRARLSRPGPGTPGPAR